MNDGSEILRIIFLDDSSNHAETVGGMLRTAGQAVRIERAEDDEDLRALLAQKAWDMVIAKADLAHCSPQHVLQDIMRSGTDIPLLVLLDNLSNGEQIERLFKLGVCTVISLEHPQLLVHSLINAFRFLLKQRLFLTCESLLQEANQRAQSLVDTSRDAIAYVHEGMYIYANESYLQMFGYSLLEEIEGMPIMDMVATSDQDTFKAFLRSYLKGSTESRSLGVRGSKSDGEEFGITMDFSPASYDGEPCIQIMIHDQSMSKELEDKLDSLTRIDLITGLYNRQYLISALEARLGQPGQSGALFFLAPDNFNAQKERFGIVGSDLVLSDFAKRISDKLPEGDSTAARFDGKMFAVLLPGVDEADAQVVAKKLLAAIEEHIFEVNDQTFSLSASLGIALYTESLHDSNELLDRSAKAYRKAEASGNRYFLYNPLTEGMVEREQQVLRLKQIQSALESDRFMLLYQPIASLHGEPAENYQVLLRMLDESGEQVLPGDFMPVAEQAGLMINIDRWVIVNTIKVLVERLKNGYQTYFFIKISGETLQDHTLLPWLRDLLRAAKITGNFITLELNETVVSRNLKLIKPLIAGLHQLQIKVAIGQFGGSPNYANLLRHASADYIKLSQHLIHDLNQNKENREQLKELIELADQLNIRTMTDLIEDANTLSTLWSYNIDYIQGHFLQEPSTEMNYDFGIA